MAIIYYNCTGKRRKELAKAVSNIVGAPAEYQFVPTYAYKIGNLILDKEGNLHFEDDAETDTVVQALAERGFACDSTVSENEEPDIKQEKTESADSNNLTVQMPADFFTEQTHNNLQRILENKAELFKAELRTESLEYEISEEIVNFPWFTVEQDGDSTAYCQFISMLCEFAKNQKRINIKPDVSDNPKYAMRCYLLRLGMIGVEYKQTRKVLLRNLDGSSAFRNSGKDSDSDEISG